MLTLYEGGFYSSMDNALTDAIKASVLSGRRVYLIVPEQETVAAELEMAEALPEDAPLSFEVTNFTRFTNTAFREIGGISKEYCTKSAKSLIMWKVLTELSPMLSLTKGRRNISSGSVRKALSAVAEMQSLAISPDILIEGTKADIHDKRLGEKLRDLALIYSLYTEFTGKKYSDTSNEEIALAAALGKHPEFLSGVEVFVSGFTSFTEPQSRLLLAIMKSAPLTVALRIGRATDAFEYKELASAKSRLLALADSVGVEKKLKKFHAREISDASVLSEICDLLWRSEGDIDNDSLQYLREHTEKLRVFSAPTIYEECEFLVADIKRKIMSGSRYSDIAIVARSSDTYLGVLDLMLDEAAIPYFISKSSQTKSIPLFKLIYTAYNIISTGFKREDVLTYAKCGLLDISRDEIDRFELYCEKWGIEGRRFSDGVSWGMNPRGYEKWREDDETAIIEINSTRDRVISPLILFGEEIRKAGTVREHAEALIKFLVHLDCEELMARRSRELAALGDDATAEEARRAWGILCSALDTIVEVLGDSRCDIPSFVNQLSTSLEDASVGHLPAHRDEVTVGSADMLRVKGKKHVYLIGVNSGEFPASITDSSYFSDSEKSILSVAGIPISPDLEIKSAREFYSFSRAFSIGRESVTLTYNERTPMLSPLLPAEVIGRIKELTKGLASPIKTEALEKSEMLYTESATLEALGRLGEDEASAREALIERGYTDMLAVRDGSIKNNKLTLSEDSLALIYGRDLYLSQTRIDKFLGCPMSYFCKYNLKLGEEEPAELGSNIIGSFVHAVIESFFGELESGSKDAASIDESDKERITESAAEKYARELIGEGEMSARTRAAISRLVRATKPVVDGLCEELSGTLYKPTFFELKTDSRDDASPDHLIINREGGGRIIVRGTIDRVDTYKSGDDVYVRVIDYKTGHTDFLPSKLKDGEYLQMFLYLKAITDTKSEGFRERLGVGENGRIIPAGVIYVKTRVNDTTVRTFSDTEAEEAVKKLQERDGMLLDESLSISAMNPDFIPPETKKKEPLRYSEEGWREIEKTLIEVTTSVADSMCSGKINATPATKGGRNCKWCRYKEICRSAVIKNDF